MSTFIRLTGPAATTPKATETPGLTIHMIPLDSITMQALIRDRNTGPDYELSELVTSIKEVGLSNPIQVVERSDGRYDLVQGYRRLSAYRTLLAEEGEAWATIPAGFLPRGEGRAKIYRRMVDENIIRKDLSFAEMAKTAQIYAADPTTSTTDVDSAVAVLFQSGGYQRRSYIRKFARLMTLIGPILSFPHEVPRSLGLALYKEIKKDETLVRRLRAHLKDYNNRSVIEELTILRSFADGTGPDPEGLKPAHNKPLKHSQRTTFSLGQIRCIAGQGGLTVKMNLDFTAIDRAKLTQGIKSLLAALD
ncbi:MULTISPECIES: ParB/RepB/Spo0J family partition protein [unclassified Yoonia]|uniref:ParB/RepB/Spo0J family partition protein n=1 Tax=unclassified Yoonia TaxID=2629118 RepID=UPI002AFFEA6F|nr:MULTISPECIES: ParB/RepB/Spo0J family partition protein [unclassified Yoonia]